MSKISEWIDGLLWLVRRVYGNLQEGRQELFYCWQRATTGIDDSMTWSFDNYIIDHIYKLLVQYKSHASSFIDMRYRGMDKYVDELILAFKDYKDWQEFGMSGYLNKELDKKAPWYGDYELIRSMDATKRRKLKKLFNPKFSGLWW